MTQLPRYLKFVMLAVLGICLVAGAATTVGFDKEKSKIEFLGSKPCASRKGGFNNFEVDGNIEPRARCAPLPASLRVARSCTVAGLF